MQKAELMTISQQKGTLHRVNDQRQGCLPAGSGTKRDCYREVWHGSRCR